MGYLRLEDTIIPFEPTSKNEFKGYANNLETLFDEYIIELSISGKKIHAHNLEQWLEEYCDKVDGIYGAIYIRGVHNEPILKSVAKLNNKKEWKLL